MGTQSMVARAVLVYAALGLLLFGWPRKQIERAPEPVVAVVPAQTESTEPIVDEVGREALRVALIENLRTRPAIVFEEKPPRPNPPPGFDMKPGPLTDGSRAALRAVLENRPMMLYIGLPVRFGAEDGERAPPPETDARTGLPLESMGDSLDPQTDAFVNDYNHAMLRCYYSGAIEARETRGIWSAAQRMDKHADELLFTLLDDPADAYVLERDAEGGRLTLDLGSSQCW